MVSLKAGDCASGSDITDYAAAGVNTSSTANTYRSGDLVGLDVTFGIDAMKIVDNADAYATSGNTSTISLCVRVDIDETASFHETDIVLTINTTVGFASAEISFNPETTTEEADDEDDSTEDENETTEDDSTEDENETTEDENETTEDENETA